METDKSYTYQPVEEITKGMTVINLGIVKRTFYNPVTKTVKLTFLPCRELHFTEIECYYSECSKLMIA